MALMTVLSLGSRLESFAGEATVTATPGGVPQAVAEISWGEDFEALFAAIARLAAPMNAYLGR